jgi:hypothetical protein
MARASVSGDSAISEAPSEPATPTAISRIIGMFSYEDKLSAGYPRTGTNKESQTKLS